MNRRFVKNKKGFGFLKFATANVRKFGASFITIAQKSTDLVVDGDAGIIENSDTKFIYTIDGDEKYFAELMKLEKDDIEVIKNFKSSKTNYHQVYFVDKFGKRTINVRLTKKEYWRITSSKDDNKKDRKSNVRSKRFDTRGGN